MKPRNLKDIDKKRKAEQDNLLWQYYCLCRKAQLKLPNCRAKIDRQKHDLEQEFFRKFPKVDIPYNRLDIYVLSIYAR